MIKKILIRVAFDLVVSFICMKAEKETWRDDFCRFCEKLKPLL